MVAVVDGPRDGQALLDHPFPDHVPGHLVLEAGHALVEVEVVARLGRGRRRPWARCTSAGRPRRPWRTSGPAWFFLRNGPTSGVKLYFHSDAQGLLHVVFVEDSSQSDLIGPALAEDLVDLAAVVRADALDVVLVGNLDVVFAVEQFPVDVLAAALGDLPHLSGEGFVAQLLGHLLARPGGGHVERAEPGDLAEPGLVERVVLRPFEQSLRR